MEQRPPYCKKELSEISLENLFLWDFFPPLVIGFRYFVLFLGISYLKDKDYSYSNKNFRLD